jgi:hypothetical protein
MLASEVFIINRIILSNMAQEKEIKLDKVYESKKVDSSPEIRYDKNSKKDLHG